MTLNEIKTVYSIFRDKGVTYLRKEDKYEVINPKEKHWDTNDLLINPHIEIRQDGSLLIKGLRLTYTSIHEMNGWEREAKPVDELEEGWEDSIFYDDDEDLIVLRKTKWVDSGFWPFKVPKKMYILSIKAGYYLKRNGEHYQEVTSNFKIVDFDILSNNMIR